MKNQIMLILLFIVYSFSVHGQTTIPQWSLSIQYLPSEDITILNPDIGNTYRLKYKFGKTPVFEASLRKMSYKNYIFEVGYRYKHHYLNYGDDDAGGSDWSEVSHSIPIRVGKAYPIPQKFKFFRRCTLFGSVGGMFDIMSRNVGNPIVSDSGFPLFNPTTGQAITYSTFFNPEEVNQVNFSASADLQGKVSVRLWDWLSLNIGGGYTQGTRELLRGRYRIAKVGPVTSITQGDIFMRGSYTYWVLGLQLRIDSAQERQRRGAM
jgi:hypothetical protein